MAKDKLTRERIEDYVRIILEEIVPDIDKRVRSGEKKSYGEILRKLIATDGELFELHHELTTRNEPSVYLAELVDITYYGLQLRNESIMEGIYGLAKDCGFSAELLLNGIIKKYSQRNLTGDKDRQVEEHLMENLIKDKGFEPCNHSRAIETLDSLRSKLAEYTEQ